MPSEIVRNDITNMQVDAIVNAASVCPGLMLELTPPYIRKLALPCLPLERESDISNPVPRPSQPFWRETF